MIIKWAGSKKWLFKKHPHLFTSKYNTYFEPFLGGGSIFFLLRPAKASISDINEHLINCFKALKDDPKNLYLDVKKLIDSHSEEIYYLRRDEFNKSPNPELFLYLNRTCYNGIYRENQKGNFNVPIGRQTSKSFPFSQEDLKYFSSLLETATLKEQSFLKTLSKVKTDDFIYVDPPYIKYENDYDSFRKYGKDIFSLQDLEDLAKKLNQLSKNNKILFSNFDLPNVRKLFTSSEWKFKTIQSTTNISGTRSGRKKMKEIVIYNY